MKPDEKCYVETKKNCTLMIVGYDNDKALFKILNSWGQDSHDGGYFYMPYNIIGDPRFYGEDGPVFFRITFTDIREHPISCPCPCSVV